MYEGRVRQGGTPRCGKQSSQFAKHNTGPLDVRSTRSNHVARDPTASTPPPTADAVADAAAAADAAGGAVVAVAVAPAATDGGATDGVLVTVLLVAGDGDGDGAVDCDEHRRWTTVSVVRGGRWKAMRVSGDGVHAPTRALARTVATRHDRCCCSSPSRNTTRLHHIVNDISTLAGGTVVHANWRTNVGGS